MSGRYLRGRLRNPSEAPASGDLDDHVVEFRNAIVIQSLSGRLDEPVDYLQEQDEWVMVLSGAATLEVGGDTVELGPREWLFLPSGLPHRVVAVEPGTDWIAFHLFPDDAGADG
jgi:cupin 2 domain-containing protein